MTRLALIALVLLAGCVLPGPTVTPTSPAPTATPAPYPRPDYGEIGHNTYPGPGEPVEIITNDAPTCVGSIEYPSEVWFNGEDIYTRTCISSMMAGAGVTLYDIDTGVATWVQGMQIAPVRGCTAYVYEPQINGRWTVQVMVLDPGGVTLCYISPTPVSRWRHIFVDLWKP